MGPDVASVRQNNRILVYAAINTGWVSFYSFDPAPGHKLLADMYRSPARYFAPCSRDFLAFFSRY